MSTFVLVHGSWHGAWCWEKIIPLLKARGHRAVAPDLPAHGADRTPIAAITLQSYVDRVGEVLDASTEPVVLVGHSMGGVVISQVAEVRPQKVAGLVYVAGFLLQNGQSLFDVGGTDQRALILPNLQPAADQSHATLRDSAITDIFYHDCTAADATAAKARFVPEPMLPVVTPIHVTTENFGRVPRAYIVCEQDHSITPECQRRMLAATPCEPVVSLDSSHSPFFSMPERLADVLVACAAR